jgi:hypothetical protein
MGRKRARGAIGKPPHGGYGAKLTVVYDETARKDFITGFRKRKDARRREALTRAAELAKEARKQARAESRRSILEAAGAGAAVCVEVVPEVDAVAGGGGAEEAFVDDEFSAAAFGSGSVVVTTTQLGDDVAGAGGEALAAALAEESRERLRALAAPALAEARARREAAAAAASSRERAAIAKQVKNRRALKNAAHRDKKEVRGGAARRGGVSKMNAVEF